MLKSLTTLALATLTTASLVSLAPTASAASCVSTTLTTGFRTAGQVAYKAASGCRDLNLTYAHDSSGASFESYAGFYKDAAGYWTAGSSGYWGVFNGTKTLGSIVLVSNLTSGRAFGVGSYNDGGDTVTITH
ncbi:hypothetical protein [Streptomyces sp. NPDC058755]|uniref:hypothetical protein n=1 Tax=unclassified Streptomyces TaxID=2593676 RepID=UPI0036ABDB5C